MRDELENIMVHQELVDGTLLYGWKSDLPLTPFAPSYEYYFTDKKIFSEEECKEWNVYLLKQEQILLDKYRTAPMGDGETGLGETSITSRFPHFNLLEFDFHLVPELKTKIFNGIKTILSVSDNTTWQETLYANSWFNVLRQGEMMNTHSHSYHKNSFYGFHLTINAIETFTTYYHPYANSKQSYNVPNKIGYLTLFPNFIPHGVSPNRYETFRISIAGDIYASTWLDVEDSNINKTNLVEIGTCNDNNELLQEVK
jgi:hypothetical protein